MIELAIGKGGWFIIAFICVILLVALLVSRRY